MGLKLYLQVHFMRFVQQINALLDTHLISPKVRGPTFAATIPSTLSRYPGVITLYFYTPIGYTRPRVGAAAPKQYALVLSFFGGGFTIGHAKDDGRWAMAVTDEVDAIVVAIGYRRGPEYPQPTAIEDNVDALRWLWAHADEYGIDRDRTVLTGFSAGGNCAFSTLLRHYEERSMNDITASQEDGKASGIISFYPVLDMTVSRAAKYENNPLAKDKGPIPPWMYFMFDAAYHRGSPLESRKSVSLSPGLATRDLLVNALPQRIAIYTCEQDMLLTEAENFRKELRAVGKDVGGEMIAGVPHGFDKPVFGPNHKKRDEMYRDAIVQLRSMI